MKFISLQLPVHGHDHKNADRKTDHQSTDIDTGMQFVFEKISPGYFEIICEHGQMDI
jgi:hypothetical protein